MNVPKLRFKEFNDEWVTCTINSVAEVISGGTPDTTNSNYWDGSINWFTPSEVGKSKYISNSKRKITQLGLQKSSAKLLPVGTILLSSRATVGESSILSNNEACTNQGFQSLIPHKNINNEFLYYLIYKYKKSLLKQAFGSTFLEISKNNVEKIKINIPTAMKEQVKLSTFLSLLDKKIELQTKKIEALKLFKKGLISKLLNEYNYEIMKIKDVLKFEQPTKYIVNSDDYINDSKAIPVLTANKAFILGYCNDNNFYDKGDSIIFDDFTMDMKYTNFNYKIKSSAIKILTAKDNNDLRFLYELLLSLNLKSEEHKRHYISIVQEMDVKIPSIEVQNSISSKLELVDNKILFEKKFLDNLTKLKKGFMQNMFV